jgi:hypothetical protein
LGTINIVEVVDETQALNFEVIIAHLVRTTPFLSLRQFLPFSLTVRAKIANFTAYLLLHAKCTHPCFE